MGGLILRIVSHAICKRKRRVNDSGDPENVVVYYETFMGMMGNTMSQKSTQSEPSSKRGSQPKPRPIAMMGAGLEFGSVVAILSLLGWWIDSKWDTSPVFLLILLFLGTVGGMYKLWRVGKQFFD